MLQKCTFFVDLSKGAEVRLQVWRILRFLDSAVNGTSDFASTVVVADFCVKHICSHFSCLKIWGFLRMPRVWLWFLGNNMNNSSSIASSCPIRKHQNILGFVAEISIFQHILHMVFQNVYQTCFCCHDYHNILTS